MSAQTDARMADLEALISHQGRAIEELSDEIRRQGDLLDRLEKTLRAVAGRMMSLEETSDGRPEITKPPHY